MPFAAVPSSRSVARLAEVATTPVWLDTPDRPGPLDPLSGTVTAELAVVGAGYTGLWTALLAKEADPQREVVVLEAGLPGDAASGRNGGFCSASLTHGLPNGVSRFAAELPQLEKLGQQNLGEIEDAVLRYGIDCGFERTGDLLTATDPHHVAELREYADLAAEHGQPTTFLDSEGVRALVDSPRYLAGLLDENSTALVDPARLVWGLRAACLKLGVRIYEQTPVTGMAEASARRPGPAAGRSSIRLSTPSGAVLADRVALATNAFPPLLRRLRAYIVPVWDYVVATQPLPADVRASLRWQGRQGLSDVANQFHYYRLTRDDRLVFGGYDAVYYRKAPFRREYEHRLETPALLVEHLTEIFPQLADVEITHSWGGAIDTCSRFSPFWGTARNGRVAYVAGFTGLGVGASRFGAAVMLDLLDGADTERTRLRMTRTKPLPFPPEPIRGTGIALTQRAFDRADRNGGRRGPWLRLLDTIGMGFDS
jgi:glycine/D-amino acid oxidase-like deaminating enzyme